jgi:membrane-associated protease RseP (regulator of RpoE activity)
MPSRLHTDQILSFEVEAIFRRREIGSALKLNSKGRFLYRQLNECKLAALCLSGGGIRSAAFGLGILQALASSLETVAPTEWDTISEDEVAKKASKSLLAQFDYLSTVSGGGYIGSWLSAWCTRAGFPDVWRYLVARPRSPDIEPSQINWLRSYSNYLTPKIGVMSADAWSAFSTYIGNLLLNWSIILPLFCCIIIAVKLVAVLLDAIMVAENWFPHAAHAGLLYPWFQSESQDCPIHWQPYVLFCGIPAVALLILALSFLAQNCILRADLPASPTSATQSSPSPSQPSPSQKTFLLRALLPLLVSAIMVAQLLGSDPVGKLVEKLGPMGCDPVTTEGVTVTSVSEPAKAAGIEVGDKIVLFDGKEVKSFGDLRRILEFHTGDEDATVRVVRDNQEVEKTLDLSERRRAWRADQAQGLFFDGLGLKVDTPGQLVSRYELSAILAAGGVVGAFIYTIAYLIGRLVGWRKMDLTGFLAWIVSGSIYGGLLGFGLYFFATLPGGEQSEAMFIDSPALPLTIGAPLILCSLVVSLYAFLGLSCYRPQSDADREWLGRAGGWMLVAAIGWFIISLLTFGAFLLWLRYGRSALEGLINGSIIPMSGVSGLITALLSKGKLTRTPTAGTQSMGARLAEISLAVAAPLFIAGLIFLLSVGIDKLLLGKLLFQDFSMMSEGAEGYGFKQNFQTVWTQFLSPLLLGLVAFTVLGLCTSYFININRFSLHAFYRNRLIRAFLGASRARKPDLFTGFDPLDNPRMHTLWSDKRDNGWRPFHIINLTLNIVSGKRLSWQERKAAPFTVSPLHCGTGITGGQGASADSGAYRLSTEYGAGISLGTAMAISGAAVSPNMGYHSSPAVTFLMSMLNVRLGWWLGNPAFERGRPYEKDGPTWSLVPLLQEALGLTTDERKYIYLSDGGHFENLGLFEMIRRRCRFILVIDSGCDAGFSFEDLANAVRKISVDLGVTIKFYDLERLQKRADDAMPGRGHAYHAVGEIDYRKADGAAENGIIIYIKPSYHGSEDAGIKGYATANPDFPHESTLDQWFSESQFESYRSLGFEIMDGILKRAMQESTCGAAPSLEKIFGVIHGRALTQFTMNKAAAIS